MREERKAGTEGTVKVNAILKALLEPRRQRADKTSKTARAGLPCAVTGLLPRHVGRRRAKVHTALNGQLPSTDAR